MLHHLRSDVEDTLTLARIRHELYQGFRTFVHDVDRIDRRVRAEGFRRVHHERRRVVWDLAVYAR